MLDIYKEITCNKAKNMFGIYRPFLYETLDTVDCEISEIPAPKNDYDGMAEFKTEIPKDGWHTVSNGDKWGGDYGYAYFRCEYTVPERLAGKTLLLLPNFSAAETLLYINGKPSGIFDVCGGVGGQRLHEIQPLTFSAKAGETFSLMFECYAGHPLYGCMVYESENWIDGRMYPKDTERTYYDLKIVEANKDLSEFLLHHRLVQQIIECFPKDSLRYAEAVNAMCEIFPLLPQRPKETDEDWRGNIKEAVKILKSVTEKHSSDGETIGYVGLIGHSHLDTAWLWPVRETLHKAARTFSNALRLMEHYDDYHFMQSSVVYLDWMKHYYPTIFEDIKKRVAEGRWEPNGGSWVECDNNITGGEYIIRQFLRGQRFLKENFNYTADCFWQPDTFGYSAALPQILKGCGINNFLTTKLSWNEYNKFPYDSFIWKGIDGSEVLTHFNLIHNIPDVKAISSTAMKSIKSKDISNMKLLSYGFGDGGGGPSYSMLETEKIVKDMAGLPKAESTTVSAFMKKLSKTAKNLPVFSGELYLELHRGTLTQMHDIKRSNRRLERAIRNCEILSNMTETDNTELLADALDTLLLNEFHDILPGTSLQEVHELSVHQNESKAEILEKKIEDMLGSDDKNGFVLCNTLSWDRNGQIIVDDNGNSPENLIVQHYSDLDGNKKMAIGGAKIDELSCGFIPFGVSIESESPFKVEGSVITTPYAAVTLENGTITSYITNSGFEVVRNRENPLNTFYCGEDLPWLWDNWDVDYDQKQKMIKTGELISCEVVSCGALQLRIRTVRKITENTTIKQDIVFYADTARIDFETEVDWNDIHKLLKVGFDVNVLSDTARFETQFGNVKRPTHENYSTDKVQFEVCNHKWCDLSDNRFGVAILNDCKYGVSVDKSDMRLTLVKGGVHPDRRGDKGRHKMTYSLLVHESGFSTDSVIKPAYELNYPVIIAEGKFRPDTKPFILLDCGNVIIETVKSAENADGIVVRLYETEGSHAKASLKPSFKFSSAFETDMLENTENAVVLDKNNIILNFRPFEIKTVYFKR